MLQDRVKLAAVLAVSATFLTGCSQGGCRDAQGRPVSCGSAGAHGGGGYGFRSDSGGSAEGVGRGGFGGSGAGGGGHGGGE